MPLKNSKTLIQKQLAQTKMKITINLILLAFINLSQLTNAQTQSCVWAQNPDGGDVGPYYRNAIATDQNGNVFVTGSFNSPVIIFGTTTLTNLQGNDDIYLVKYSPTGGVLWAASAGGTGYDQGLGISTDLNGNVFITGGFTSPTIVFGTTTLTNLYPSNDVFIAKYSPSGTLIWATSAVGVGVKSDKGFGLSTDGSGNVFVTGAFASPTIAFGTTTLTNALGGNDNTDIFVAKYSPSGMALWATSVGGSDTDAGNGISTDATGNVFITGAFRSPTIAFGTTTLNNSVGGLGNQDFFIVKYSPSGTMLWVNSTGSIYNDYGSCVSTDVNGNAFVTGYFTSPTLIFGTTTLTNFGGGLTSSTIFVVKYSPTGTVLWASSTDGNSESGGRGISTDGNGNAYVTGVFSSTTVTFGTITLANSNSGGGSNDLFVAKYSPLGMLLWAISAGGSSHDYGVAICTDPSDNIIITGTFASSTIVFGTSTLTKTSLDPNSFDVFIAKLCSATVGINENQKEKGIINIYPNPFDSNTTISFSIEQTNTSIKLVDALGKELILISHFHGRNIQIDKGKMETGIYFIQIIDENNNKISKKIVLQ